MTTRLGPGALPTRRSGSFLARPAAPVDTYFVDDIEWPNVDPRRTYRPGVTVSMLTETDAATVLLRFDRLAQVRTLRDILETAEAYWLAGENIVQQGPAALPIRRYGAFTGR